MAQFLLITTLLSIAGLIATTVVGYMSTPQHVATHILCALVTVILGLFSQTMTMFFFIGTGKQLKDKAAGTKGESEVRAATRAMAMKVSPAATFAMMVLMVTFIMGGGVASGKTPKWLHIGLTVTTLALYARAYWIEINAMMLNAKLMQEYLKE
jgi:small-conductance mechanosensitive channel